MLDESTVSEVDRFMELAVRSGLLAGDQARSLLEQFRSTPPEELPFGATITSLMVFLVATGNLTPWQCDKLRHGKHKGFFLDKFKLIDWQRTNDEESLYIAQDTNTGKIWELAITPRSQTNSEDIVYRVVRQIDPARDP